MSHVIARRWATARQLDPTRTASLIRLYRHTLTQKFNALKKAIRVSLVDRDVFGLKRGGLLLHVDLPPDKAWAAADLAGKNRAFAKWLADSLDIYFLEDSGLHTDVTPEWIQRFIRAAYAKGASTAMDAIAVSNPEVVTISLPTLLNIPFHRDRLTQLFDRNFAELKGFTSSMATHLQRVIADGLVTGDNPIVMARAISSQLNIEQSRAERIARTEVIRTNAEAQLNTFERFGIQQVHLEAEWITAGDDRVCPECEDMEGEVFSIEDAHGMIPLHPSCRCDWLPVLDDGTG